MRTNGHDTVGGVLPSVCPFIGKLVIPRKQCLGDPYIWVSILALKRRKMPDPPRLSWRSWGERLLVSTLVWTSFTIFKAHSNMKLWIMSLVRLVGWIPITSLKHLRKEGCCHHLWNVRVSHCPRHTIISSGFWLFPYCGWIRWWWASGLHFQEQNENPRRKRDWWTASMVSLFNAHDNKKLWFAPSCGRLQWIGAIWLDFLDQNRKRLLESARGFKFFVLILWHDNMKLWFVFFPYIMFPMIKGGWIDFLRPTGSLRERN